MHNVSCCTVLKLFFVISFCDNCKEQTLNTERRFDNIRNVLLVCFGIEIFHLLTACLDVLCKVVVGSVRNAPQLAPAEREQIFEVGCSL